jgi:hypothetical protein
MPYDLLAPPQQNRGILDPTTAALLQAGFAGLAASGPQRRPVGLGQVAGQAGQAGLGAYQAAEKQQLSQQMLAAKMAEEKRLHDAQIGNYDSLARQRQAEVDAKKLEDEAQNTFRERLDAMQRTSDTPLDPISVLEAGVSSGAFKPRDITDFMGKIMERQATREQRLKELEMKIADNKRSDAERAADRAYRDQEMQDFRKENIRLAAALRPPRNRQFVNTAQGIMEAPDSGPLVPALGSDGKPLQPQSINREQVKNAFKLRTEYNAMPEVKAVNDLEIRLKPVAEYGLSVAKGKAQQNPVKDQELLKLYLMVTHPKGDRISVMDYSELRKLPDLPARVYEAISAVFSGRTLSDRERADMLQTITNRYRGLTEARSAKRKDIEARAKAAEVPVDLVFGD